MDTKVVTELLEILRRHGYSEFPKTGVQLFGFAHSIKSRPAISKTDKLGQYVYLGIKNGLAMRLNSGVYTEDVVRVLVHIDGVKLYKDSREELLPIVMKIVHKDYECEPFVVALYYGNAKAKSLGDFLNDFVKESKELTEGGLVINDKKYAFKITGIVGDAPARSYIKGTKGPGEFNSCERCTVPGVTKDNKRVYAELNCSKRSKETFMARIDKEHQSSKTLIPLLGMARIGSCERFSEVRIYKIQMSPSKKWSKLTEMRNKCVFMQLENAFYAVCILHDNYETGLPRLERAYVRATNVATESEADLS
ncbi:uncharacterized protein LOC135160885 [Diachasmimorpha longicaudata]|uniref:uncharacterized protein LOC135160885 n=1 Tax=Diachasmimorpha longicaudata TaxID=58733 RepID=UPI0030B8D5D3